VNWPLVWAALAGAVLGSLADWLFGGVLFHHRYQRFPEVWRSGGERRRIAAAQVLALVTSAAFVALAWKLGQTDGRGALKLAAMVWLIGPLPMLLANAMFIRIDHLVTASHATGWLAKLLLIAAATAWILP
jgi:membrane protein YqaA with SNARE-associated domain